MTEPETILRYPKRTVAILIAVRDGQRLSTLRLSTNAVVAVTRPLIGAGVIEPRGNTYQYCPERADPLLCALEQLLEMQNNVTKRLQPL